MSLFLPQDLVYTILNEYMPPTTQPCCRVVAVQRRALWHRKARLLQHWMRTYRLCPGDSLPCHLTKRTLIRYYAAKYPDKYLLRYPEFVVRKCQLSPTLLRSLPPQMPLST